MPNRWKRRASNGLRMAVVLTPWLLSMYLLYWLDSTRTWSPEAPHRGKLSVAILAVGMGLSFLV